MWIRNGDFDLDSNLNSKTMCYLRLCKYGISFGFCFIIREIEKVLGELKEIPFECVTWKNKRK